MVQEIIQEFGEECLLQRDYCVTNVKMDGQGGVAGTFKYRDHLERGGLFIVLVKPLCSTVFMGLNVLQFPHI